MEKQERLAREWAEYYRDNFPQFIPGTRAAEIVEKTKAAAAFILTNTTPPTMDEIEWDPDDHVLAGATNGAGYEMVMLAKDSDGMIHTTPLAEPTLALIDYPQNLTPNGKRYELRDITVSQDEKVGPDQAEHPKCLRTVEDYENAPDGTVVTKPGHIAVTRRYGNWSAQFIHENSARMAENGPWDVLRWGMGE